MKLSNRTARAMLPVAIALLPLVLSTASSVADARERQVTRTGPNGQSAQRLTSRQRTGDTFTRNRTTTGPRGNTSSTNATTTRTDDGATRSVTHTGVKGGETQVNSSIARTDDGYVKERSITGPNGNTATRSSDVSYDPATRTLDRNSVTTGPKGNSVTTDATFAVDTTKPIITKRDGSIYPNPQTGGLSAGDTATLFQLYPPPAVGGLTDITCRTAPIKRSTSVVNAGLFPKPSELLAVSNNAGTKTFTEYASTLASFGGGSAWGTAGAFENHVPWLAGDFNKDGLTDIAEIQKSGALSRVVVRTTYGSGLNYERIWADRAGKFENSRQWLPGDFNKDGRDDLAVVWRDADQTTVSVLLSDGTKFSDADPWSIQDSPWDENTRWTVGDFNNDGRADLAAISNDQGVNTINVRLSTGLAFSKETWATRRGAFSFASKWLAGDFSGDGASDLVEIRKDGTPTTATVSVSTGAAFSIPIQWHSFLNGTVSQPTPPVVPPPVAGLPLGSVGAFANATFVTATSSTGVLSTARQIDTGTGGIPPVIVVDPPNIDTSRWAVGDFNDDG